MGKHYEDLNRLYDKLQDPDTRKCFFESMDNYLEDMERKYPAMYDHAVQKIEETVCAIDLPAAKAIVAKMYPRGQQWSFEDVKKVMQENGVQGNDINYYLVMNMMYNDYYDTATAFGLQRDPSFFFMLTKNFIEDPDAKPLKVEKYFKE